MATIKISELEEVTKLSTGDFLPIVNDNETKKVSLEQLDEMLTGGGIPEYVAEFGFNYNSSSVWWSTSNAAGSAIQAALQKALDNGETYFKLIFRNTAGGPPVLETYMYYNSSSNTLSQRQQYSVYTSSYTNEKMIYSHYVGSITDGVVGNGSTGYIWSLMTSYVPYTTTAYVDDSVSTKQDILTAGDNITIVDNVISATGGGASVDLSNYYTKEETNSAITTNLSNYSTTTQMDEALATKQPLLTAGDNITIDENNVISATGGGSSGDTAPTIVWDESTNAAGIAVIQKWVDYYNATGAFLPIYISKGENDTFTAKNKCLTAINVHLTNSTNYTIGIYGLSGMESHFNKQFYVSLKTLSVTFTDKTRTTIKSMAIWGAAEHKLAVRYDGSSDASQEGCLSIGNTKEFTPTGDYNPATKKYVDDAITSAITTVLEAEY